MLQFKGFAPLPLIVTVKPHDVPLLEHVSVCPVSASVSTPSVALYADPPVIVMLEGVVCHVGFLLGTVITMVEPIVAAGEPLSVTVIRRLQVCGAVAVKATVQLAGKPEPVTVGVKVQLVPLDEQVKVCPVSRSVAIPSTAL